MIPVGQLKWRRLAAYFDPHRHPPVELAQRDDLDKSSVVPNEPARGVGVVARAFQLILVVVIRQGGLRLRVVDVDLAIVGFNFELKNECQMKCLLEL